MPEGGALKTFVERWRPGATFEIVSLSGDASANRRYWRVWFEGDSAPATAVIQEPVGPKPEGESTFLNVLRFLRGFSKDVPELYAVDKGSGLVLLEDFGDLTLEQAVTGKPEEVFRYWYRRGIELLLEWQIVGTRRADASCVAFSLSFDVEKLMWELDFFIEHVIRVWKRRTFEGNDEEILRGHFKKISAELAAESRYFTHRDYHSRNLMVAGDRLGAIDFQDARLGPLQYDLASLLRDSYVSLPEGLEEEMIDYYLDGLESQMGNADRERFMELYDFMTIQRNLKAAGSFAYLDCVRMKNRYLANMPRCLGHVRRVFDAHPEFGELDGLLGKYLEEFRPEAGR